MHDLRTVLTCMSSLLQMIPPNSVLIMLIAMESMLFPSLSLHFVLPSLMNIF